MYFLRKILVNTIIIALAMNSSAYAQTQLHQGPSQINGSNSKENILDKATSSLNTKLSREAQKAVDTISQEVIPGLGASIISMAFATMLGITLVAKCRSMPSALTFSGTSALWIASELSNWNGYNIRIENVDRFGKFSEKDIKEQKELMKKIVLVAKKAKKLQSTLGDRLYLLKGVKTLEDLKNIKGVQDDKDNIESFIKETLVLRSDIKKMKDIFEVYFDEQYDHYKKIISSLSSIQETTEKKAKNTKIAAVGFALASALAFAEHFNLLKAKGACFSEAKKVPSSMWDLLINKAYAEEKKGNAFYDGKTIEIEPKFANLDKIGILAGAGLGAAYLAFKMKFLKKILGSGMSRGIVFAILAGTAYFSAEKLQNFSSYFDQKMDEVESFRSSVAQRLTQVKNSADNALSFMNFVEGKVLPFIQKSLDKKNEEVIKSTKENFESQINHKRDKIKEKKEQSQYAVPSLFPINSSKQLFKTLSQTLFLNLNAQNHSTPKSSCFVRTKDFIKMDKACNCHQSKSCLNYHLTDFSKPNSKIGKLLYRQTKNYLNNINGHLSGYSEMTKGNLNIFSKKGKGFTNLSDQILSQSNQNTKKVKSLVQQQTSLLIKSIPSKLLKNSFKTPLDKNKKQKNSRPKRNIVTDQGNNELKISKSGTFINQTKVNVKEVSKNINYKINDIHKSRHQDIFKIISRRYERKILLNP